ncbi:MAG: tRNA dihydrouridine(20/20a) synthase DusA, partial [Caldimonas sp.]
CLMAEPRLVADCVQAMCDAVSVPVTVKHRIGIDRIESYEFMRDFVGKVADAGCRVFIVHARNAWLKGISPKENRELPPLRHELLYRLKREFPALTVVLNGGVHSNDEIEAHLDHVDGVMVGREAYHHPWSMSGWDTRFLGAEEAGADRAVIESTMVRYMRQVVGRGEPWSRVARHMMGLRNGLPGARVWRQVWSDHALKALDPAAVAVRADAAAAVAAQSAQSAQPAQLAQSAQPAQFAEADAATLDRSGQVASTMPASASAKATA